MDLSIVVSKSHSLTFWFFTPYWLTVFLQLFLFILLCLNPTFDLKLVICNICNPQIFALKLFLSMHLPLIPSFPTLLPSLSSFLPSLPSFLPFLLLYSTLLYYSALLLHQYWISSPVQRSFSLYSLPRHSPLRLLLQDPHEANLLVRQHPTKKGYPQIVLLDHGLYKGCILFKTVLFI